MCRLPNVHGRHVYCSRDEFRVGANDAGAQAAPKDTHAYLYHDGASWRVGTRGDLLEAKGTHGTLTGRLKVESMVVTPESISGEWKQLDEEQLWSEAPFVEVQIPGKQCKNR
jgi:hypothetical protein